MRGFYKKGFIDFGNFMNKGVRKLGSHQILSKLLKFWGEGDL